MATVAPGWTVDENGALRRETIHRMGRRRNGWDYCAPCIYEITIVLEDRRSKALGRLVVRNPAACIAGGGTDDGARVGERAGVWLSIDEARALKLEPDQVEARVERSALVEAVFSHFRRIAEFTPEIKPLYCEIMPDHLHLILHVVRSMKRPLGNAIAGFKTGCEKIYAKMGGEGRLFAEGFVDEILSHQGQLGHWFTYLKDNPRRLAIKTLFPWLFKRVCRLGVDLWLAPQTGHGGTNPQLALRAENVALCQPPRAQARGYFSAFGNRFITMQSKGFSPLQKPSGRYFDACADGKLLMLAPAAWPYQPGEKPMTRSDATAMNWLCQWIAGEGAAEINYHGMKPENIDDLALKAVTIIWKQEGGNEDGFEPS